MKQKPLIYGLVTVGMLLNLAWTTGAYSETPASTPTADASQPAAEDGEKSGPPADGALLSAVITQVQAALDQYQRTRGSGSDALPALTSAELDFKVTTTTSVGGTINLIIFKIGASREDAVVSDVTMTYSLPTPPKGDEKAAPSVLTQQLVGAIRGAAAAAKKAPNLGGTKFSKLAVNLQFGVKWDGNAGANVPISIVTVGINGDKNRNAIQSVKLVFGK